MPDQKKKEGPFYCRQCGAPIEQDLTVGRRRLYCGHRCRDQWRRARRHEARALIRGLVAAGLEA